MKDDLLIDDDMVDFDTDISDLDEDAGQSISDGSSHIDARRKIERLLEAKALKELDEDIEWWYPD